MEEKISYQIVKAEEQQIQELFPLTEEYMWVLVGAFLFLALFVCSVVCYIKLRNRIASNEQTVRQKIDALDRKVTSASNAVSNALNRTIQTEFRSMRSEITSKTNEVKRHLDAGFVQSYNKNDAHATNLEGKINQLNNSLSTSVQTIHNEVRKQASDILKSLETVNRMEAVVNDNVVNIQDSCVRLTSLCETIKLGQAKDEAETQKNHVEAKNEFTKIGEIVNSIEEFLSIHCDEASKHMQKMETFNDAVAKLTSICGDITKINEGVLRQETSVASMINKHQQIAELTDELNRTAKDVFGLMKLLLMSSVIENSNRLESRVNPEVKEADRHSSLKVLTNSVKKEIEDLNPQKHCKVKLAVVVKGLDTKQGVGILGDIPEFGNWKPENVLKLQQDTKGTFILNRDISTTKSIVEFKYVIIDLKGKIELWENGGNRQINTELQNNGKFERNENIKIDQFHI